MLGLDLGERWIGVAVSDETGIIASPLEVIDLKYVGLTRIRDIASDRAVEAIIAGLPLTMAGDEGFQAQEARSMAHEIGKLVDLPIVFWDERLTSSIAEQVILQYGRKQARRLKSEHDAVAAAVMLQGYLDSNPA